jgi:hypothetical protein
MPSSFKNFEVTMLKRQTLIIKNINAERENAFVRIHWRENIYLPEPNSQSARAVVAQGLK